MGTPLLPVIADFFMEAFAKKTLDAAPYKPTVHRHDIDRTFLICSHNVDRLIEFVMFLNSFQNIKFTMEMEEEGRLPFLDTLFIKKADGTLGRTVFRKASHMNLCINSLSHQSPGSKTLCDATCSEQS